MRRRVVCFAKMTAGRSITLSVIGSVDRKIVVAQSQTPLLGRSLNAGIGLHNDFGQSTACPPQGRIRARGFCRLGAADGAFGGGGGIGVGASPLRRRLRRGRAPLLRARTSLNGRRSGRLVVLRDPAGLLLPIVGASRHWGEPTYVISQSQMKLTVDDRVADPLFVFYLFQEWKRSRARR